MRDETVENNEILSKLLTNNAEEKQEVNKRRNLKWMHRSVPHGKKDKDRQKKREIKFKCTGISGKSKGKLKTVQLKDICSFTGQTESTGNKNKGALPYQNLIKTIKTDRSLMIL